MANKTTKKTQSNILPEINNDSLNDPQNALDVKLEPKSNKKTIDGLGDVVKAITNAIGIKTCDSCEKRRQLMNDMFSFLNTVKRELTPDEVEFIEDCETNRRIGNSLRFVTIYNEVFGTHVQPCNCPGLLGDLLTKLTKQIEKQKIVDDDDLDN